MRGNVRHGEALDNQRTSALLDSKADYCSSAILSGGSDDETIPASSDGRDALGMRTNGRRKEPCPNKFGETCFFR